MIALEGRQAAASARRIMQLLRSKSKFNVMCYNVLTMLASCARGDGAQCFNSMSKRTLRSAIAAAWSQQPQLHLTRYPKSAGRKESECSDTKVCRHSDDRGNEGGEKNTGRRSTVPLLSNYGTNP